MSFEGAISFKNLLKYGEKCCNGGRWKPSVQSFEMTLLRNTSRNHKRLKERTFKPCKTNNFMITERGKWREIKAHKISDRQVYKSFCNEELKPSTERLIVPSNAASQVGKGTQYSIRRFRRDMAKATRKWGNDFYVITLDFHDYFGSIPHDRIIDEIGLTNEDSRWLLQQYVDIFPGDIGIGIGGEPSQDISVVYPSKLDRMLSCEPSVLASGRYMDDGYAICHTKEEAQRTLKKILEISDKLGLVINRKRTKISWMKKDSIVWLKKRTFITNTGKIVMRLTRENIRDEIRRVRYQKDQVVSGRMPIWVADVSIECWCAYARDYNSRRAMKRVINVYMQEFDVSWKVARLLFKKSHTKWIKRVDEERRKKNVTITRKNLGA